MKVVSVGSKPTPEAELRSLIGKFDSKHQKLFRSVRTALRKRVPTANELAYGYPSSVVVGYSPTDKGIEAVLAIAARADGLALYFGNGPTLPDPKGLLLGSGKQTRFIAVESATRLAHPDVKALIAAAIDQAPVPLPSRGKGTLIMKTDAARKRKQRNLRARLKK